MKQHLSIFWWGMSISFLGSLPPGITNLLATQIYHSKGIDAVVSFAAGFVLAESIMIRLALWGMQWMRKSRRFFQLLEWTTAGTLLVFSIGCFVTAENMQQNEVSLSPLLLPAFLMGVVISFINPMHFPFWLGWTGFFVNKGTLISPAQHNLYIVGIIIGTVAGIAVYLPAGPLLLKLFQSNQYLINCIAGLALVIAAFLHIRKMVLIPVATRHDRLFRKNNQ
jgi:threonine/homoserine/homoserine lactone efflux protein